MIAPHQTSFLRLPFLPLLTSTFPLSTHFNSFIFLYRRDDHLLPRTHFVLSPRGILHFWGPSLSLFFSHANLESITSFGCRDRSRLRNHLSVGPIGTNRPYLDRELCQLFHPYAVEYSFGESTRSWSRGMLESSNNTQLTDRKAPGKTHFQFCDMRWRYLTHCIKLIAQLLLQLGSRTKYQKQLPPVCGDIYFHQCAWFEIGEICSHWGYVTKLSSSKQVLP